MKKFTLSIIFFLSTLYIVKACDVCGCVLSHNVLPSDTRTYIGVNFRNTHFSGYHTEGGGLPSLFYKENYQFVDITAKYSYKNRWEFIAALPFMQFVQVEDKQILDKIKGISDANLTVRYALINKIGRDNHRLSVGFSVGMPTGKYNQVSEDGVVYHARQAGSGAISTTLSMSYGYKRQNIGAQTSASFRHNTTNVLGYHRGNSGNVNIDFFYKKRFKNKTEIIPRLGFAAETADRNQLNGINYTLNTSRRFLLVNMAFDVYLPRFFVSISYQNPIFQTLETGQLANKNRISVSLNYLLGN